MNMKKLLMGSLALAAIGGASSVGLYFHVLAMQSKGQQIYHQVSIQPSKICANFSNLEIKNKQKIDQDKKHEADRYYADTIYECAYSYLRDNNDNQVSILIDAKKGMLADGYSHAEVGLIEKDSIRKAHKAITYAKSYYEKAYLLVSEKDKDKQKALWADLASVTKKVFSDRFSEQEANVIWADALAKAVVDFKKNSEEIAKRKAIQEKKDARARKRRENLEKRRHFYRLYNWIKEKLNKWAAKS